IQHLAECDECRRELADWEHTAAELAFGANPAEPSSHVRARIMNAVRKEKQSQGESRVVTFPQNRKDTLASLRPIGAIAAGVLFLVLISWIIVLVQQNKRLRTENETLAYQNQWMDKELTRSEQFVRMLNEPGAKYTMLHGSDLAMTGTGHLIFDRTGQAMLMVDGLPPLPEGKEYQFWSIVGKNPPIPGGTFVPDDVGRAQLTNRVPEQALVGAVFAVTLEPAGGVPSPTGAIYLRSGQ
ncbi:MAG TPA: anti-sigma factor, partial [Pyrinomonadaceae bacterium]|nr:anti-sigma factor [Pyrinomonadaceae bacterium]